jgi:hypothetical protein
MEKTFQNGFLEKAGSFSVKSMYAQFGAGNVEKPYKHIWKVKIPLKIKIFLWLSHENAILTKDNLIKRKWQGDENVPSAILRKRLPTCSLNAPLQNMYGVLLLWWWEHPADQAPSSNL